MVSGHIRGLTTTLPLEVEMLYNEYNFTAAFAAASLLTLAAVVTLVLKKSIEVCHRRSEERARKGKRIMSIQVEQISKQYGSFTALEDVSLTVADGELVASAGTIRIGQDDAAAHHRGP